MLGVVVLAALLVGVVALANIDQRRRHAQQALAEGQQHLDKHRYAEAVQSLRRGLAVSGNVPGQADLKVRLTQRYHLARRAELAEDLHALADWLRFWYGAEMTSAS